MGTRDRWRRPGRTARVLDFDQLGAIWKACEEIAHPNATAIQLMMLTGARPGEVLSARWGDLRLDRWWTLPLSRTGVDHRIFLADRAWELTARLTTRGTSRFLFPGRRGDGPITSVQHIKNRVASRAGVGPWKLHDLRRTFLSHLYCHCTVPSPVVTVCGGYSLERLGEQHLLRRRAYDAACQQAWIAYGKLIEGVVEGRVGKVLPMCSAS